MASAAKNKTPKGPPEKVLDGLTLMVSNQCDLPDQFIIKEEDVSMKNKVQISDCWDSNIVVEPKVNSIRIDGCSNCKFLLSSLISVVELVNSSKIKLQVSGVMPALSIDKCTGVDIFLSKESLDVEIITSKSGEMNVNIPNPEDETDWIEIAIPEQFQHKIEDKKLTTKVSDLYTS